MTTKDDSTMLTAEERLILARKHAEAAIVALAWKDEAFRSRLLADPKAALTAVGIRLPDDVEIRVRLEAPGAWELVLPASPREGGALSEEDMVAIAGAGLGYHPSQEPDPST
ncbi:MAG TPA: NHLP leader peptide family RiPP precursor [Limnochordales bacterium]